MTTTIATGQSVTTGGDKGSGYGFKVSEQGEAYAPTLGVAASDYAGGLTTTEIDYIEAGVIEDSSWTWLPFRLVYSGADNRPTQTFDAIFSFRLLGIAIEPTKILLTLPQPSYRREVAAQRPLSIGDDHPVPHQASNTERPLHKDFLGIGGPTAAAPTAHREVTIQYVDDTHVQIKMMGDDGTIRTSASIALS